jgi:hypothetical protein
MESGLGNSYFPVFRGGDDEMNVDALLAMYFVVSYLH